MSYNIAVSGKGGTGKTSIACLVVRYLLTRGRLPVLAVDADPNANFGESVGLAPGQTVGSVIFEFEGEKLNIPPGLTKEAYLDFRLNGIIVESKGMDLVTMGRGEGPDCYCYPNLVLRNFIDKLSANYAFMITDNEAGMEHLSRRTTRDLDDLLIVSDYSIKGIRTVARIKELIVELQLKVKKQTVIVNMAPPVLAPAILEEIERLKIGNVVVIPEDEDIRQYDLQRRSLLDLPQSCEVVKEVDQMLDDMLREKSGMTETIGGAG